MNKMGFNNHLSRFMEIIELQNEESGATYIKIDFIAGQETETWSFLSEVHNHQLCLSNLGGG